MKLSKLSVVAAAGMVIIGGGASASTLQYATSVLATGLYGQQSFCGNATRNADRSDICNSLGMEDGDGTGGFTSSGNYKELNYYFGTDFTAPVHIWEITGGLNSNWVESLDYEFFAVGVGGNSVSGTITNVSDGVADGKDRWKITFDELAGGPFNQLRVVRNGGPGDGFDIDAIGVSPSPVPLPAGGLLLLTALGGVAALRRKRKAA